MTFPHDSILSMSDLVLDGKTYVTSKDAAALVGYTQDYVGQLCRSGAIEARRVSGLWHISVESIKLHKEKADAYKPIAPQYQPKNETEESLIIDGNEYVTTQLASKISTYHHDYVSQIARAGTVPSRQIAYRWYIDKKALLEHKLEKDALLRAVQADSVGLYRKSNVVVDTNAKNIASKENAKPTMVYQKDQRPLFLNLIENKQDILTKNQPEIENKPTESIPIDTKESRIPIRIISSKNHTNTHNTFSTVRTNPYKVQQNTLSQPGMSMYLKGFLGLTTASAIILISYAGYSYIQSAQLNNVVNQKNLVASVGGFVEESSSLIAKLFSKELIYTRNR
jgi:hypothetical protein